ncbi:MAG: tRNA guanosine(34) transglycosylase Tgt [Candidatus Daviesbacteria bacterium]|nr:tRNA guanosine(34) transglycosylase Tgt [Candidatus Daviesbacteria bacterium]
MDFKTNMIKTLKTNHGTVTLPSFFPDGTLGVVRGVDSIDLENAQVEGLVINTFHLMTNKIDQKIKKFKGIHGFMNWQRSVITDSGGFQVMSLVHDHPEMGKISDQGITFKWNGEKILLTPEKSIEFQLKLGTDIAIVLDDCVRPEMGLEDQKKSVERTISWAKRSKTEFDLLASQGTSGKAKPLLFSVVQGGNNKKLRKYCAEELIQIGFDGYCFGGFPVQNGKFLSEIVGYVAKLLPDDKPKYALGVGKPENIVECVQFGYQIFDCVIPTREARHQKLYIHEGKSYSNINIGRGIYVQDKNPISKNCDCHTCKNFSRAYLHHLFKIKDSSAFRLATIHNLRFYSMLMEALK